MNAVNGSHKQAPLQRWSIIASALLLGRKIVKVRYMQASELAATGWDQAAVVLELDNGILIYPSQDDEGNGPGALFTTDENQPCLPVI